MLTDKFATYRGKNKVLERKRKLSNEKTDQIPSLLTLFRTVQMTNWMMIIKMKTLSHMSLLPKKTFKTGGNLVSLFFLQIEQINSASKIHKLNASEVTYFLETLINIDEGEHAAYNLSYSYLDKNLRKY